MPKAKRVAHESDSVFLSRFKQLFPENATQQDIADIISRNNNIISRQSVGNWLSGEIMPNANQIIGIAQAFHVSVDWLLGLSDVRTINATTRAVSEYTGLDENALKELKRFKNLHSTKKSENKKLYTEYDYNVESLNRLFHLGYIQTLSELLTELQKNSSSFMDDSNLSLETYHDYEYRNEQSDLVSFKIQKLLFALLNEFDVRENNPEKYKIICRRMEQLLDESIEFDFKSDDEHKDDKKGT